MKRRCKMKVREFKVTPYYKKLIKELAYAYEVNPKYLYNEVLNPFGSFSGFPKGYADYLKKFKNMRHYILNQLLDILLFKRSILEGLKADKNELKKINDNIFTLKKEIEKIKKRR
jgi:hypothetical protein